MSTLYSTLVPQVEQGLRLYNQHKQQAAVSKWRSALKRIRKPGDKFILLGYLYQAYMDWGKYRSVTSTSLCLFVCLETLTNV